MSVDVWLLVLALAVIAAVIKGAGPVALGGRDLPPRFTGVVALLAPALLAALVVAGVAGRDGELGLGVEAVGVAAGGAIALRGGSILLCVVVAVGVTAVLRAVT
ncbi:AzlD domain-containing protein [Patulibacter sp.]|uniref:AzlD domain-containing protein n=1 Tax=Patulibacter sp. TaxID=1912859 RepID=UPI002723CC98|nr:AzlD domain-containing protein [Patulibacter sp.]MDO9410739.1 AzlD domain-containing protein [Patulibacter sp.]